MEVKNVSEGDIKLIVPKGRPWDSAVFYNPEAEINRDISVASLSVFSSGFNGKITVLDGLSGTGIRGLRYGKEIGVKSVLNDDNPKAVGLIKKNIALNRLGKFCKASKGDANLLMRKKVFNVIDLDPFGSPMQFLDSAARSIYHKGMLAVTATDTGALNGVYPPAGLRKYGLQLEKTDFYTEVGVRALATAIILACAKYDKAFVPLLSFAQSHYYRVFGKIENSGKIEGLLKEIKFVSYCKKCGWRSTTKQSVCGNCKYNTVIFGPLFTGKIQDRDFCSSVLSFLRENTYKNKRFETALLEKLIKESEIPQFYYELSFIFKGKELKPIETIIEALRKKGFAAERTHFSPTGIKTTAGLKELKIYLRSLS
ncbi:MAG: tRNA (guanine(10)-N(2))-dimethyltransferase [Candidatus Aenigmarchaeota archaeon]|nr:tRNA (guanine(10)-N(2))-dimethyltransferase [Candidatus Aenigmarchaeota archaeon]